MPLIFAEVCGRWGCSWQEGILAVILMSFKGKGALILLGLLLMSIFLGVLLLLAGLVKVHDFVSGWGRAKQNITNLGNFQQQGKRILLTVKVLGRTLIVANKAVTDYRQQQDVRNQANSPQQEKDTHEPDETAVNRVRHEAVNNSVKSRPQGKRILPTARFLCRTLRNIAKD